MEKRNIWISDYLEHGAENARSTRELMRLTGFDNERFFRAEVERERREGAQILASSEGLFLPAQGEKGREELRRYIRLGRSRIAGQARALRPALDALRELEGQLDIEEVKPLEQE